MRGERSRTAWNAWTAWNALAILSVLTTLAALGAVLSAGCAAPREPAPAQGAGSGRIPYAQGPVVDLGQPVASTARVPMTPEQIWEVTGDYTAVRLWAFVAQETARDNPGDFHQTLFSEPDRECVDAQRNLLLEVPDPPIEDLLECGRESAARGRDVRWAGISGDEREARARRSVGLLFWSIDPPSMMSVQIARQRGLEVNVKTNADFARFATRYDVCEAVSQGYVERLAAAETSEEMARIWIEAERNTRECSDRVTSGIFAPREPENAD